MNQLDNLVDSYYNDGYVYCLKIPSNIFGVELVKIGKIEMKRDDTEQNVIDKLLRRYNTYYVEYDVLEFMRVGNCHLAEKYIFEILKEMHYKKEMYVYDNMKITNAFKAALERYPNIRDRLASVDINTMSKLNGVIRDKEGVL